MKEKDIVNIITQGFIDEIIPFIVILPLSPSLWWIKKGEISFVFWISFEFSKWIWSNRSYIHSNTNQRNKGTLWSSHGNIMTKYGETNDVSNTCTRTMRRIVWLNIGVAHSIEGARQFLTERSFDKTINI